MSLKPSCCRFVVRLNLSLNHCQLSQSHHRSHLNRLSLSHLCLMNLHLKLKNLTGKTPVELIKTMRMKRACELMKETNLSIADIAEQTGFQTPGYFITVFKNHFGETPGHYASRVRQQ